MENNTSSPFSPGSPVPVELFVGRSRQIQRITRAIDQATRGRQQNLFLIGERGVGKTSIASFCRYLSKNESSVLGIHVFLGGVATLHELVRRIFESFIKSGHGKGWFEKVRGLFGDFIKDVGMFGVTVGFAPPEDDLDQLVRNFGESLYKLTNKLDEEAGGILIILDDLDTLSEQIDFANWYKSLIDEIATHYESMPVSFLLIGLPEIIDNLAELQPSLPRIFRIIEVEKLTDEEVENFFNKAFGKVEIDVDQDAMNLMVNFSSGVPVIMQEIGDATFWVNDDEKIDHDDALYGILTAAENIGRKYLDPKIYRAIRSKSYRSILRKIGLRDEPLKRNFTRKEMTEHLTESEKNSFDNFIRRLREIGVLELDRERGRGCYRFVNDIYPVYVYMEARTHRKKSK